MITYGIKRSTKTKKKVKFYKGRNDIVFKTVFSLEDNKELLRVFLEPMIGRKIQKIELINLDIQKQYVEEKGRIVDFLAKVDGDIVHIELNSSKKPYTENRNYSYFTSIMNNHIKKGQEYDLETSFINIDLTFDLGEDIDDRNDFLMCNSSDMDKIEKIYKGESKLCIYNDKFKVIVYNMDKIVNYYRKEHNKEMIEKYKYLIMLDLNKEELKNFERKDEYMNIFEKSLLKVNMDPTYKPYLTSGEEYIIEKNTERSIGRKEGMEKGTLEIAKNMIKDNASPALISKYTNLSLKEIKKLMNRID